MMQMDMQIQGLQELDQQLAQLTEATASKVLYGALFDAAKPIWDDARQHAPVAPAPYYRYTKSRRAGSSKRLVQPGTLRAAVRRQRIKKLDVPAVGISLKSRGFYGHMIENGTPTMAARPFLRPAFDRGHAAALDRFRDRLRARIDRVVARQQQEAADGAGQ